MSSNRRNEEEQQLAEKVLRVAARVYGDDPEVIENLEPISEDEYYLLTGYYPRDRHDDMPTYDELAGRAFNYEVGIRVVVTGCLIDWDEFWNNPRPLIHVRRIINPAFRCDKREEEARKLVDDLVLALGTEIENAEVLSKVEIEGV